MKSLTVCNPLGPDYEIYIDSDYSNLAAAIRGTGIKDLERKKACIVADSKVAGLYGEQLLEELNGVFGTARIFTFPMGEQNKTLDTVKALYTFLIENRFDRKDLLFALGGGVTGDLCGYASATYLRGVDFIQLPTSLLAMVDSSIGGKTGVDFDSYKNMVGAFHMPRLVYMNLSLLSTLDRRQFSCGMAEILKHGFIKDAGYLKETVDGRPGITAGDYSALEKMVYKSCLIKGAVVAEDPTEQGIRAHLNFGHTLGHAIEKYMDFEYMHGECVALGIAAAAYICFERGLLSETDYELILDALRGYELPVDFSSFPAGILSDPDIFIDRVVSLTRSDKKAEQGAVKFVLLRAVGEAFTDRTVTEDEMRAALRNMF